MDFLRSGFMQAIGAAILAFFLGFLGLACQADGQTYDNTLMMLQQGKARGHLVLTSDGKLGVDASTSFGLGANNASLSFDGDVDFADSVRHITESE